MQTYEIYAVRGFCDSEWEHLGNVQVSSEAGLLPLASQYYRERPEMLVCASQRGQEYYCGLCGQMMPISHFPH
jgi:hypothetical protein